MGAFDSVLGKLREKVGSQPASMKRPAAGMKRPAAATSEAHINAAKPQASKATPKKKPAGPQKIVKKGNVKKGNKKNQKPSKPPNALALSPGGCAKCRYKPGCTPSCFKQRKEWP